MNKYVCRFWRASAFIYSRDLRDDALDYSMRRNVIRFMAPTRLPLRLALAPIDVAWQGSEPDSPAHMVWR